MPILSLPTGNVIYVSVYEYYFLLPEDKVDEFFQQLIAENAGVPASDDPFSNRAFIGKLEVEDVPEVVEEAVKEKIDYDDFS